MRPMSMASEASIALPISWPISSLKYGKCHWSGASKTPSSDTNSAAITFLTGTSLLYSAMLQIRRSSPPSSGYAGSPRAKRVLLSILFPLRPSLLLSNLLPPGRSTPVRRRDVLVEPEEVRRVVAALDLGEPMPDRSRVGFTHPPLPLVAEKVDVHSRTTLVQGRREVGDPPLVHRLLLPVLVDRAEGDHDPAPAVGERRSLCGHAGHRPAQDPDLGHRQR